MPAKARMKGLVCPVCYAVKLRVYATREPCMGQRVRYRRCEACGTTFRTDETITAVFDRPAPATGTSGTDGATPDRPDAA